MGSLIFTGSVSIVKVNRQSFKSRFSVFIKLSIIYHMETIKCVNNVAKNLLID